MDLLSESLPETVSIYAVAGSKQQAEEVIGRFEEVGIGQGGRASEGGFSDFVISREAEEFLHG